MSLFFLYPVAAHVLMYQIGHLSDKLPHGKIWITIQVFLSGPALFILGLILYFKYGQSRVNKIFGVTLVLIGLYWFYNLLSDVIDEAA